MKHRELMNLYLKQKAEENKNRGKMIESDYDVLVNGYQFIRDEDIDKKNAKDWKTQMAVKYYNQLYKEYALADMSRYKENKIGLRWRTKEEVLSGKGQFICGNIACEQVEDLHSYEVLFTYKEQNEIKNTFVKLRICPECALKLYHKKITEYEKEHVSGINEQSTSQEIYDYIMKVVFPSKESSGKEDQQEIVKKHVHSHKHRHHQRHEVEGKRGHHHSHHHSKPTEPQEKRTEETSAPPSGSTDKTKEETPKNVWSSAPTIEPTEKEIMNSYISSLFM